MSYIVPPCKDDNLKFFDDYYWDKWISDEDIKPCCEMNEVLKHELLHLIMKIIVLLFELLLVSSCIIVDIRHARSR